MKSLGNFCNKINKAYSILRTLMFSKGLISRGWLHVDRFVKYMVSLRGVKEKLENREVSIRNDRNH